MHTPVHSRARAWVAAVLAAGVVAVGALTAATAANAAPVNLSQGKTATASSTENADYTPARYAVDGNAGTRWASLPADPQTLSVDLGQTATLDHVTLVWEAAYGKAFTVQTSTNGTAWTTAATVTNGTGGTRDVAVAGTARYVRLNLTARGTGYGYSLWEFQVFGTAGTVTPPACGTANVAQGKTATASTTENGGTPASAAVDGNLGTRWSSTFADAQWWQVDLGSSQSVCKVTLRWEGAYGKAFGVQTSTNGTTWTTAATVTNGTGGVQTLDVAATARYVRLDLTARGTGYGYSLWEVQISTGTTTTPTDPIPGGGDLGPNVHVFTPTTGQAAIQAKLDETFTAQEEAQFGTRRDQFLFAPGTYDVQAHIGFNTSINGLGRNPDDVNITGGVWADAQWFDGNATQNFWRSMENLKITPFTGENRWAVSQAAPMRRIHVAGDLAVFPSSYGWASGGFTADSKVDGAMKSASQQQWYTRDSALGRWEGSVWNMVFSGVTGSPAPSFPNPSHTVLDTTPISREKPYLYLDGSSYAVFVPSARTNARGVSWPNTPGPSIPLSQFYVAKPGDSADRINAALAQGLHLLLTPGIYTLDKTIDVNRADTVVLGLGYATIVPTAGQTAMKVGDVNGVRIAGVLFDAGVTNSPAMLEVGSAGNHTDRAANPVSLHDVFVRVGGRIPGKVTSAIVVNSDDTLIDHIWSWRGDHGAGVGWNENPSAYGLVVNGNDVLGLGLFVEHYQKENTLWNGDRGRTIFYQNELPYDVPNQAAWQNGTRRGYAGYRVADAVTTHELWGGGVYSFFNVDPSIVVDSGFQVPVKPGVRFHNILTVSLGGNGVIAHVINDTGGVAQGTATIPAYLVSYGG
ncbi:discoidin domain-containing protein [Cellulomonas humilata]|uniref:Discoidin domain-containing protein n=1 Tax=Cellulomonas humilata TaxID=144055 RepID=A0A7Y6DVM3_9CELL|nr:discoidin domain-containing protein [Cellulomonas humilata]NUU16611.1 discoidin domain-containing protein [Cellulomonas humilata]